MAQGEKMKKFFAYFVLAALCLTGAEAFAGGDVADGYRAGMIPRFVKYVQTDSRSDNDAEWMTPGQEKMARLLFQEIRAFGFPAHLSSDYYIYVNIPSNLPDGRRAPALGISAHYDTTPEIARVGIKAQVIARYDGNPIHLKNNHILNFDTDPYLRRMVGKTIVTSDGTTNLGADDKAGITIVVTLLQTLAENPSIPHGPVQIVLTPNEDVGRSAERLDLNYYHPDFAYDFDGGVDGETIIGNFSAERVIVTSYGVNGHQSYAADNGYLNAVAPLAHIIDRVALNESLPNRSSGFQGYVEPNRITYDAETNSYSVDFRFRYFSKEDGQRYHKRLRQAVLDAKNVYGVRIEVKTETQYENVEYGVKPEALTLLQAAMQDASVTPQLKKERAGTTSAMIMAKHGFGGYTLFTGQNNPHSYTEWLSEEDMFNSYRVALNLVKHAARLEAQAEESL